MAHIRNESTTSSAGTSDGKRKLEEVEQVAAAVSPPSSSASAATGEQQSKKQRDAEPTPKSVKEPKPPKPIQPWDAFPVAAEPGVDDNTVGKWAQCPHEGYMFLRAGNSYMTLNCRKLAHRAGFNVYVHRMWGLQRKK